MIRVLHYIGQLQFGGSQSFVMEIYRKIDRTRVQFDFITFPNEKEGFYDEIITLGGCVFESPQYNGKNHFCFMKWWDDFFKSHPEYKIVHMHVRSVASLCINVAHKYGCYVISHSHSTSNGKGVSAIVKYGLQLPLRYKADYLMACSSYAGEWLFGKNVRKKKNYEVVTNAIDTKRFEYNSSKRIEIRRSLGLEEKFVVGHVGRMVEPKNHFFLLEVFAEICKWKSNAILLLVGNGVLQKDIEEKCKTYGISEKVIMLGSRSNTQDYYQAMDVFLFPSLWEGLGISVVEAQTSGLPCVISERIPEEVDFKAGLITVVNLKENCEFWAQKVMEQPKKKRESYLIQACNAGYDVTKNARKLQAFYENL